MAGWRLRGYAVGELLGRGASSEVWRARVTSSHDPVALKRLFLTDAEQIRRAHTEAALLTVLDHPNLVRLHAVVPTADAAVLVLDLADGGNLADLLAVRGRLTPGEVITAIAPVAAALAYVHGHGVVHGDVSPANLLFTPSGTSLLADLGVARLSGDLADAESTPAYVDPAVASGCVPTAVSDVFMLGAVALHALTGAPLWPGESAGEILASARAARVAAVPARLHAAGVPADMAAVVVRALTVDPVRRGSAADFALDLRRCGTPVAIELMAGRSRRSSAARGASGVAGVQGDAAASAPKRRVVYDPRHAAPVDAPSASTGLESVRPGSVRPGSVRLAPTAARLPPTGLTARGSAGVRSAQWRAPLLRDHETLPPGVADASRALPPTVAVRRARPVIPRPPRRRLSRHLSRRRVVVAGLVVLVASVVTLLAGLASHDTAARTPRRPAAVTVDWVAALHTVDATRSRVFASREVTGLDRVYLPGRLRSTDATLLTRLVPTGCSLRGLETRFDHVRVAPARHRAVVVARARIPPSTLRCPGRAERVVSAVAPAHVRIVLVQTPRGVRIADLRRLPR